MGRAATKPNFGYIGWVPEHEDQRFANFRAYFEPAAAQQRPHCPTLEIGVDGDGSQRDRRAQFGSHLHRRKIDVPDQQFCAVVSPNGRDQRNLRVDPTTQCCHQERFVGPSERALLDFVDAIVVVPPLPPDDRQLAHVVLLVDSTVLSWKVFSWKVF